ncbi:MAG: hypothetical protein ABIU05_13230 [Nitrospirales bacterium]
MTTAAWLSRLEGVRSRSTGEWLARCPAHQDKNPSLSLSEGERGLLVKCWSGCTLAEITVALGLRVADLFYDSPTPRGTRPAPRTARVNLRSLAFRFELAALDRRMRAERVLRAVKIFLIDTVPDHDLDRLVDAVARRYADIERAELYEGVADGLRIKAFARKEGTVSHAG